MNTWRFTILLLVCGVVGVHSDPLNHWQLATHAGPRFMRSVAEHDDLFVAVGVPAGSLNGGEPLKSKPGQIILSSTNGVDWPTNYVSSTGGVSSVVYGLHGWVAVGDTGAVLTSPDALTWTTSTLPTTNNFSTVAYGNGIYVAAAGNTIWRSADASEWLAGPGNTALGQIIFGSGVFVGAGSSLFLSSNGVDWVATTNLAFSSLAYSQAGFFAARNGQVFQSLDGAVWTQVGTNTVTLAGSANGVLVGFTADGFERALNTSTDGVTWVRRLRLSVLQSISCVAGHNSLAVGVGSGMVVSDDGENWSNESTGMVGYLFGAGAAFGKLFCVGEYGDLPGRMLVSRDGGYRWVDTDPPNQIMYSLAFGNGKLVGAGWSASLYSSTNGQDWTAKGIGDLNTFGRNFNSVVFGTNLFVAVGDTVTTGFGVRPLLYTSPDGVAWTFRDALVGYRLNSVVYGQNGYVAVGDGIVRSTRGGSWAPVAGGTSLEEAAYGRGVYVAVGGQSIMISSNSLDWTQVTTTNSFYSITFGGGVFVAVGSSGRIYTSINGLNWEPRTTVLPISRVRYVNGSFFGLSSGFDAAIYRSDPLWQLSLRRDSGALTLSVTGVPQTSIRLQSSPQVGPLAAWTEAGTFTFVSGSLSIPISASQTQTFYRTVSTD